MSQLKIYFDLEEEQGILNTLEKLKGVFKDCNSKCENNVLDELFLANMKELYNLKYGNPENREFEINKMLDYLNDKKTINIISKEWFIEKLVEMKQEFAR